MVNSKTFWLTAIISIPILVVSYLIANEINERLECRTIKRERSISNERVLSLEAKAHSDWNSFPLMGDGTEARDPTPGVGGRYFSNFDDFFQSEYAKEILGEKQIGYQFVLNYPECFPLREVVEIQKILSE